MFNARNLSVTFDDDKQVLKDISFDIKSGECISLIGPNGAGKSTLCECLLGIIPHLHPAKLDGLLLVGGVSTDMQDVRSIGRLVGFAIEDPESQFVSLSVGEEVALTLAAHSRDVTAKSVQAALEHFGIGHLIERAPRTLSEGEKRRVTLAALEAAQPEAVVLDNPLTALDEAGRLAFCEFIYRANKRSCTILFSTHDIEVAFQTAERLIGMKHGRIVLDHFITDGTVKTVNNYLFENNHSSLRLPPDDLGPVLTDTPAVEVTGLAFSYPRTGTEIFRDIDFVIQPGEALVVRGPNGSGKTTLLYLLAGLLRPTRGIIRLCGISPRDIPIEQRGEFCGYVFQNPEHQILMNQIGEELLSAVPLTMRADQKTTRRLEWMKNVLTIPSSTNDPHAMSQGQKKLIALLTALVPGPRLLLLDEAEFGLDPLERVKVVQMLEILRKYWRTSIIVATHSEYLTQKVSGAKILNLRDFKRQS